MLVSCVNENLNNIELNTKSTEIISLVLRQNYIKTIVSRPIVLLDIGEAHSRTPTAVIFIIETAVFQTATF